MSSRMPHHGRMLVLLLFGLLQIQTGYCDTGGGSGSGQVNRPSVIPALWEAVTDEQSIHQPYTSAVKIRMYNSTRLLREPPGLGASGQCTGQMVAWNMIVTAAHCFWNSQKYEWEVVDVIPGGSIIADIRDETGHELTFLTNPFGVLTAFNDEEELYIHPRFDITTHDPYIVQDFDLALIVLDGPVKRSSEFPQATMELSMLQSVSPETDEEVFSEFIGEAYPNDQIRFHHFPAGNPQWLKGWGKMHASQGQDVQISADGIAEHRMNSMAGSSGGSIQVLDSLGVDNGGSASGAIIRIIHTSQYAESREGLGMGLTPEMLQWIAWVMHNNKVDVNDLDQTLSPRLDTEVCLCELDSGSMTLKLVAEPYATNCICPGGKQVPVTQPTFD